MKTIRIDVGVCTSLKIILTEIHFYDAEEIIFAIKNDLDSEDYVVFRKFTEEGEHIITITPEESLKLQKTAKYGFGRKLTNGNQYRLSLNGGIEVSKGVYRAN